MREAAVRYVYPTAAFIWLAATAWLFILHATEPLVWAFLAVTIVPAFAWTGMLVWSVARAGWELYRRRWLAGSACAVVSTVALGIYEFRHLSYDVFYWRHKAGFECLTYAQDDRRGCLLPPGGAWFPETERDRPMLIVNGFLGDYTAFIYKPVISEMGLPPCRPIRDDWNFCQL